MKKLLMMILLCGLQCVEASSLEPLLRSQEERPAQTERQLVNGCKPSHKLLWAAGALYMSGVVLTYVAERADSSNTYDGVSDDTWNSCSNLKMEQTKKACWFIGAPLLIGSGYLLRCFCNAQKAEEQEENKVVQRNLELLHSQTSRVIVGNENV